MNTTTQNQPQGNPSVNAVLKLGLDVDLQQITATIQCDHQHPKPARSFTAARLVPWVREKVQAGYTVWTVYESCGFGYTLHYQLVEAGAHSLVISPVRLHPQRRRKNDRLDSRQLCLRLSRYLDGQRDELPVIRAISRFTGLHRDTVLSILESAGEHCARLLDAKIRNVKVSWIQVDEIHSFVLAKEMNDAEHGAFFTYLSMDMSSKLIVNSLVGKHRSISA